MRVVLLLSSLLLCFPVFAKDGRQKVKEKPFSHKFQFASFYQHISNPDWKDAWWRRNQIPQYQIGYRDYFLKARYFTTGQFSTIDWSAPFGAGYQVTETGPDGKTRRKDSSVFMYNYRVLDIIASYAPINTHRHNIQIGFGASHRKGEDVIDATYQDSQSWVCEMITIHIPRNDWGAIGEISYSVNFLKYAVFSLEAAYRIYPDGPGVFTGGVALGLQIRHRAPAILQRPLQ